MEQQINRPMEKPIEKRYARYTGWFFALSFVWTWACYGAIILLKRNPYSAEGMPLLILGGCSPTFVGLILAMMLFPKAGRIDYLKRTYQARRISLSGWLIILLLFPAIYAVAIGADLLLGGALPQMTNLRAIAASPLVFFPLILLSFFSGPFSEELGWRGFALEPLLRKLGFAGGSVLLGLIWGVWHLPLYFMPETWHGKMGFTLAGFPMFLLLSVGLSCSMSFVYIRSNRSILSAMLLHLVSNFTSQLLEFVSPRVELTRSLLIFSVGMATVVYVARKKVALPAPDWAEHLTRS
jgi:membrane protease YdiL (CAAX protease family)